MFNIINRRSWIRVTTSIIVTAFALGSATPPAFAKPGASSGSKNRITLIQSLTIDSVIDDTILVTGLANVVADGVKYKSQPFSFPITVQTTPRAGACPILNLELGPINLDLLGLVIETSQICLDITAFEGGGLLGDLLCSVANLLNGGLPLNLVLAGADLVDPVTGATLVSGINAADLLDSLKQIINAVLLETILRVIGGETGGACTILDLALGPVALDLLGLQVILDDCANGPVTVTITAVPGQGNLLGNLLCQLVGGGLLNLNTTLQQILNQLLGAL